MKYRLTTIEQDAAGTVYRCAPLSSSSSSLADLVFRAWEYGYVPGAELGNRRTIIAVEFTSEEAP